MGGAIRNPTVSTTTPSTNSPSSTGSTSGAESSKASSPSQASTASSTPSTSSTSTANLNPSPGTDQSQDMGKIFNQAYASQLNGIMDAGQTSLSDQFSQAQSTDGKDLSEMVQQRTDQQVTNQQVESRNVERSFQMKSQQSEFFQQQQFKAILTKQTNDTKTDTRLNESRAEGEKRLQTYRVRSQAAQGLLAEGEAENLNFRHELPPGYRAFMQNGPRGKALYIYSDKLLNNSDLEEENAFVDGEGEELEGEAQKSAQGTLASGKKFAKELGEKDLNDIIEEAEQFVEGEEGVEKDEATNEGTLKKSMGAKAAKTKGAGGENEDNDLKEHPWQNFGEAIERHTVLFSSADSADSAQLVSQANFAGAIIMGAAIHIKLKGVRLDYSGTSHHGLPIPRGDEALEMGRNEVVAGFERDMGQLGVESVFVNGQRFELANADDERKLKALVKDNPELYKMIEDIREAIRESRYFRTCLGLREEGPGGRA